MESQFLSLIAGVIGLVVGVLLTWLLTRGRIAAAVEQGKAAVAVDLATANERARALEAERLQLIQGQEALRVQAAEWREALDLARDERAQLNERASRVPTLEAQVATLLDQQETNQQEILRLATSEAEKAQSLQSATARLTKIEQTLADTERDMAKASTALQQSNERRATLDAEAARIPILERKLAGAEQELTETRQQAADLREASGRINAELKAERDALATLRTDWQTEKNQREQAEAQANRLTTELAELTTQLNAERSQAEGNLKLLLEAKEALSNQFKSLANDILEEKAKRFTEQNQTNIGQLLDPLKERITEFKAKVEEIHNKDTEQQATLKAELTQLKDLNRQMTEEAHGLATALKGQAKKQGNWGNWCWATCSIAPACARARTSSARSASTPKKGASAPTWSSTCPRPSTWSSMPRFP